MTNFTLILTLRNTHVLPKMSTQLIWSVLHFTSH